MQNNLPVWYPFTPIKQADLPIKIVRGEGIYLYDESGKSYVDAVSSWWVNLYGHRHPKITEAIKNQLDTLDHVLFADFTHEPAEELASLLLSEVGNHFAKVFFSDNGSTAVEVAIKQCVQYYFNTRKELRTKIIAFENAYHGDTFGAMSAGAKSVFSKPFEHLFFDVKHVSYPSTWIGDESIELKEEHSLTQIKQLLEENTNQISCLIIEPLVQGAGGMLMCRPEFLDKLQKVVENYDVKIIFDEVMTGFGRTGSVFAFQQTKLKPDCVCLSKGITGGFLPLSVTISTQELFNAFYSDNPEHTFYHGHSYTANPISCSAAVASTKLIHEFDEDRNRINWCFKQFLPKLSNHSKIEKIRLTGTVLAFDLKSEYGTSYLNPIGKQLKKNLLNQGYLVRPLGNTVYIMPPFITPNVVLNTLLEGILFFLDSL
jgi:adenosylmethionine-8-amino-7-oxononanoate aminotransferase